VGNVAAIQALVAALDVASPRPKNWTVCHIWGYDDPSFAQQSSVVQDPRYFSCIANMVWLPTALKGFTDTLPEIKAMLRICAFYLYGWACEHPSVATKAEQVRSGWTPSGYPQDWPSVERSKIFPPGTAPFSDRIERKITKRKAQIKASVQNADLLHYPRDEVLQLLKFWRIEFNNSTLIGSRGIRSFWIVAENCCCTDGDLQFFAGECRRNQATEVNCPNHRGNFK